jgi:hypothetical protein
MLFLDQSDGNQVSSPVPIGNHCFAAVYAPPSAGEEPSEHKLFSILNLPLSPGPIGALFQILQPFPSLSFVILSDELIIFLSFLSIEAVHWATTTGLIGNVRAHEYPMQGLPS